MASPVSVPNTFVAATDAVAAEVNANFTSLVDYINANMVTKDGTAAITGTQTVNNLIVSGTLTAQGNLDVDGTLKGDVVASNGSSVVLSNGTNGSDATFKGDVLNASGTVIVDVSAATFAGNATTATTTTGNAATASKWLTARTLTVDGDMTGSVSIDGNTDVTLTLAADLEAADIPDLNANKIDAGTFGTGNYTFPNDLAVNGLLNVSSQKKIEFGNTNDQIRFDDDDDEFAFWIDGVKQFQIGGAVTGNDVVTRATGTFKSTDSGSQFPTGSGTAAHIITGFGLSALVKNSSVAADKENVSTDLGSYLTADMIDSVVPKMWNRITAPGYPEIGPIADDMETISEFLASHGTDANGDQILMGVDQTAWMSLMTLAIQDLRDRMEAVEAA
jgi:cytoskeletal protein CcmA (bactofilin family)